jgi:hypothetical protein
MPINYGELTIIYNKEQKDIFTSLSLWLNNNELSIINKLIFLFDDGEICEAIDKLKDFKFIFFNNFFSKIPNYFEKNKDIKKSNKVYFSKKSNKNGDSKLDFKQLFSLYTKYDPSINIASYYNMIYYCYKSYNIQSEIFGIIRIKSNKNMPRFQFAYDSDEFTKEEIVYLINYIFNNY